MNLLSPSPYWPIKDGIPADYPALEADIKCDVVILGAGITGSLVAYHLAKAGIDSVVIDKREVGHGSTAGSTSLLQYEIDVPLHRLARIHGPDRARRAYVRCRDAVVDLGRLVCSGPFECGFEKRESLFFASKRAHLHGLRSEFEARRAAGIDVRWWDEGHTAGAGSLLRNAAIVSRDAAQADPYRLTHSLLQGATRLGARVFDRSPVTRSDKGPRGISLKTAGGARIRAKFQVIATGYEADLELPRRATKFRSTFAFITEPVSTFAGWPGRRSLIWETADPYVYLRTTPDNRILIGGYDEDFRDASHRDRLLAKKTTSLNRRLRQVLPRIPFEVAYAWAGTFAHTPDGLPYIGRHPALPRTWVALGYGGNGIVFSTIAAEMIRDQILGQACSDEDLFGFDRPQFA